MLQGPEEAARTITTISRWVYVSHACTRWNQRMWQFAIGIFLVEVLQQSLPGSCPS